MLTPFNLRLWGQQLPTTILTGLCDVFFVILAGASKKHPFWCVYGVICEQLDPTYLIIKSFQKTYLLKTDDQEMTQGLGLGMVQRFLKI